MANGDGDGAAHVSRKCVCVPAAAQQATTTATRLSAVCGRIFLPSPSRPTLFRPFWARLPADSDRLPLSLPSSVERSG